MVDGNGVEGVFLFVESVFPDFLDGVPAAVARIDIREFVACIKNRASDCNVVERTTPEIVFKANVHHTIVGFGGGVLKPFKSPRYPYCAAGELPFAATRHLLIGVDRTG